MKKILAISLLLTATMALSGQLKTYITLDAGPAWDVSRVNDPPGIFSNAITFSAEAGIDLWQEILGNFYLGTGLHYHEFYSGVNLEDKRPHQPSWRSYKTFLVPLRVGYRISLALDNTSLTPVIGYQYGRLSGTPLLNNYSSRLADGEGNDIRFSYFDEMPVYAVFGMVEAGVSANYTFKNNWQISAYLSWLEGLRVMKNSLMLYHVNGSSEEQAFYTHDGSRLHTSLMLHVPMSNAWQNRKSRRHQYIENSAIRNSRSRYISYLYFGGLAGPVWRSFFTSNLANGPLPIEGKGIFRFANLHYGALAGIMFTEKFSIDVGANLHRSTTIFSMMYAHEADPVVKSRAPFFLEFPLMFRFSYPVPELNIYIVPAIGASVLTHFAGPVYATGTGIVEYLSVEHPYTYTSGRTAKLGYLVKPSLGIEYTLPLNDIPLRVTLNATYNYGLVKIDETEIYTQISENSVPDRSIIEYRGNAWVLSIGVKYPILLGKRNRKCGAMPENQMWQ